MRTLDRGAIDLAELSDDQIQFLADRGMGFVADAIQQAHKDSDTAYVLQSAALVFFMQTGFAMLTVGSVRTKNTKYILLKNLLDACAAALSFWTVGYGFAYGIAGGGNPFIGNALFFLIGFPKTEYVLWFFQFAFAATAATIVSGAVAERTKITAYIAYSTFITALVYPIVVHWVWSPAGWLSAYAEKPLLGVGLVDFAGCTVVHIVGGISALIGAAFVGPRIGRYTIEGELVDIPGHSTTLQALGTFILWLGWYGFNCGSTLGITGVSAVAATAAVNTTIAGSAGAVASILLSKLSTANFDLVRALNGALAGLVSITAGCAVVEPYGAFVIGVVGAAVYAGWSEFVKRALKVDDVVDASAVHFACGWWGALATALFATREGMAAAYRIEAPMFYGAFYAPLGYGHQMLATALIGAAVITAWAGFLMTPFFAALKYSGHLRVAAEDEETGMDISKHGGLPFVAVGAGAPPP